jgi:hypothetical protein
MATPDNLETVVREQVDSALKAKLGEYRRLAYAFLIGLGLLVAFLTGNRLMSERSLLVVLHDQIFGIEERFEKKVHQTIDNTVAFSYSNHFWLQFPNESTQHIAFYANPKQRVIALVEIKHKGTGTPHRVAIRLNRRSTPIWSETDDLDFERLDLSEQIREPTLFSAGATNVHLLRFALEDPDAGAQERVFVRVLLNVVGLESGS